MAVRRRNSHRWSEHRRKTNPLRIEPLEDRLLLATFLVNLTTDEDDFDPADGNCDIDAVLAGDQCTLRAAIQQSTASVPGVPDEITFNIGTGGPQTIAPQKALPPITHGGGVLIDGTSQPPQVPGGPNFIELNGQNVAASGLVINTQFTTVRGLVINRFGGSGIAIQGGSNHIIAGNFIGTDGTGLVALPNTGDGISLFDSRNNTIGGANAGDGNLISGNNGNGIGLFGNNSIQNMIQGNRIGLNAAGNGPLPNGLNGVHINDSAGNTVGGSTAQTRNVISANLESGVRLTGAAVTGIFVLGNSIGTDASSSFTDPDGTPGTGDELGNRMHGIRIDGAPANFIGGTGAEEFNVIAGNQLSGINLVGVGATDNLLRHNFIGTNTDGIPGLGNFGPGVFIQGASKNTIGGPQPTLVDRNVIAFNAGDGVLIVDGAANRITRNVFLSNGELGIDLAPDGVNVPQDPDPGVGANNLQNFPELTPASRVGTSTRVRGVLTSVPNSTFVVDFFSSNVADASGFGEGQAFQATFNILTNAAGVANIDELILVQLPFGTIITATATDPTGNTSEFSNAVLVTPADLSIDKNDSADPAIAGTGFIYQVAVTNNGPSDAVGIEVADTLPNGLTFDDSTSNPLCAAIGQQVACSLEVLAVGATAVFDIGVQVASSIAHGTVLSNTATVSSDDPDLNLANNQSTEDTTVNRQVDLRVQVADNPDPVIAGSGAGNLVHTVTVTNDGPSDAGGVTVDLSNVLPAGATFVSAVGDGTNNFDGMGTDLWTIGSLARGAAANLTVTYTVGASTAHNAVLSVTADNAKANELLINLGNDADTETTTVNRQVDLRVAVTDATDPVIAGSGVGNLVYTVTVTNDGPSDAGGVTMDLSNVLPAGTSFVSAVGDGMNNFDAVGTDLWTIGTLIRNASANLTVTYTVGAATAQNAIVSLTADNAKANDPLVNLGNDADTETTTVNRQVDLRVAVADTPDPVIAGSGAGNLVYTVTVTNDGPSDASGVRLDLSNFLPAGTSFVSATGDGMNNFDGVGTDLWSIGPLTLGASANLTVTYTVGASTAQNAVVRLTGNNARATETLINPGNDADTETTTVNRQVDLRVGVTDNTDPVIAGSGANNLVYTVTVTNDGASDASAVTVDLSNVLPAGVSFVSATGPGMNNFDGVGTDLWTIGTLARNAAVNLTVTYTVGAATAHNAVVSLTADNAMANETLVNVGNDADTETTTVNRQVDLRVAVADSPDPVIAGSGVGNLVYTVTVTNDGPSDASGVTIDLSNVLPAGVSFVSATGTGMNNFDGVGTDLWTIGSLARNAIANLTVTYTVGASTANNAVVSLTANNAMATETLVNVGNDADTETTTVNGQVDLRVAVTDAPDPVIAGSGVGNLVYTVTVTNDGPSNANGVTIDLSNVLPAGVSFVSATGPGMNNFDGVGTDLWTIGPLALNAAANLTVTYTVGASTVQNAVISLTANNAMASETLVNVGNDADTETTTVNRQVDLRVAVIDLPDPVIAGSGAGNLVYTVTVTNDGPSDASGVRVDLSNVLPAGVTFVSATGPGMNNFDGAGTDLWTIGPLALGAAANLTVTYTVGASTAHNAVVSLTANNAMASESLVNVGNDADTETTTVNRQVDLRVAVTDIPDPVIAGSGVGNLVYTVTVTNDGPSDASGARVDLSNALPPAVTFVSATGPGINNFDGVGTDLWTIGTLARNAAANLTVTYTVGASTAHGAIVSLTADNAMANDPLVNPGNDADTETTTVNRSADLSIDKADAPDPVLPGGTVTYTLTVQNVGPSDAAAVQVTDTLPVGVTFLSASPTPGCNQAAGVVTCDLGTLAAGASAQVSIDIATDPAVMGVITNTATVASATFDSFPGNNMTTEDTTIALLDVIVTEFTTTTADRGTLAIRYTIAGTPPPAIEFAFFASVDSRFDPGDGERPPRIRVADPALLTVGAHLFSFDGGPYAGLINDPSTRFVVTRGAAVDAAGNAVPEADLNNNDVNFLGAFHHGPFPSPLVVRGRDDTDRSNGVDLPADNANDVITIIGGATVTIGSSFSAVPIVLPSAIVSEIVVLGLGGNDTITGDATVRQPLRLRGDAGDDMLTGGAGGDELLGGPGDDIFRGGLGDDVMDGGGGSDTADFSVLPAKVVVNLVAGTARGQGRDILAAMLNVIGSAGRDRITGNAAPNILLGGAGNDLLFGGDGGDAIDGGLGNDTVFGEGGADILSGGIGNDCVCGGAGNDTMDGDAGNDRMYGGADDDEMRGGDGNDIVCGGIGNDMLSGDAGNDSLNGGDGIDQLLGGLDFDFILFDLLDPPVDLGGVGTDGGKAFLE